MRNNWWYLDPVILTALDGHASEFRLFCDGFCLFIALFSDGLLISGSAVGFRLAGFRAPLRLLWSFLESIRLVAAISWDLSGLHLSLSKLPLGLLPFQRTDCQGQGKLRGLVLTRPGSACSRLGVQERKLEEDQRHGRHGHESDFILMQESDVIYGGP